MNNSEFYSACDLEGFNPDYMFYLGDHVVCAVMIDCDDEVPHIYLRQYRHSWEYDFDDIRRPTYIEMAYLMYGMREWPNLPKYDHPLVNKAMDLLKDRLTIENTKRDK
jgi:hypothetical protein